MACYLVTGGSGYIGSRLVTRLRQDGHRVLALYRDATRIPSGHGIIPLGLGSVAAYREALHHHAVEGVFHLAGKACYAQSENDIAPMIESNITLGTHILEAMQGTDCRRFVNVATYWQHYDGPEYNPICLYAATKQAFMDIMTYYAKWCDLSCISLKFTDVYGDKDPRPKIFALIDRAAATGKPLKITAGEQYVSFLHVEDAVDALCTAMRRTQTISSQHETYTVGTTPIMLKKAIQLYLKINPQKASLLWGEMPYRHTQIMSPWLGAPLPDWQPRFDLETGLRSL